MHREISCASRIPISGRLGRPILGIPGRAIIDTRVLSRAVSEIPADSRRDRFPAERGRVARLLEINPFVRNVRFVRDLMPLMSDASLAVMRARRFTGFSST